MCCLVENSFGILLGVATEETFRNDDGLSVRLRGFTHRREESRGFTKIVLVPWEWRQNVRSYNR